MSSMSALPFRLPDDAGGGSVFTTFKRLLLPPKKQVGTLRLSPG